MKWALLIVLWAGANLLWIGQSRQGLYEDHAYIQTALGQATPPAVWNGHRVIEFLRQPRTPFNYIRATIPARGLVRWSIWRQAQHRLDPIAFRLGTLLVAGVTSLAVGLLAWRLGASAWLAVLVMALHPLTVEAVALIAGRFEIVSTLGVVLACVSMTGAWWVWRWLPLRLTALGASLVFGWMGQETVGAALGLVPLVMLASARTIGTRAVAGLSGIVGVALLVLAAHGTRVEFLSPDLAVNAWTWARLQSAAAVRLLMLVVVPWGQTQDFDYDHLSLLWQRLAVVELVGLGGLAVALWRRHRPIALGLAWVLIATLPRLIVPTPRSYLSEHQFYLALVGCAVAISGLVQTGRDVR